MAKCRGFEPSIWVSPKCAELAAIPFALRKISSSTQSRFCIYTDSMSALETLPNSPVRVELAVCDRCVLIGTHLFEFDSLPKYSLLKIGMAVANNNYRSVPKFRFNRLEKGVQIA
ncbi:hypothetical protein AVEN_275408-1 [Araneus ventricosus]|uniref:RNase H type-1 domain-containing protein n=1 Tax=Araneus ventricosus TaxID=182803 RepID=A0A4Y2PM16_ARAVE|nr:hypothetical protein AVEN_275408-1 [Araneus ventricosus]